jgi:hypothetical protein
MWETDPIRIYEQRSQVPPMPSLDELEALLDGHGIGDAVTVMDLIYRLEFDGMVTTNSGVTAQSLADTVIDPSPPALMPSANANVSPLLVRIAAARPDLRERINRVLAGASAQTEPHSGFRLMPGDEPFERSYQEPVLLRGGAWEKTGEWIGLYGDLDTFLSWKYLEADLTPGHEFTHQLIPGFADDIFLHCRVIRRLTVRTDGRAHFNAIECLYAVDFGVVDLRDPSNPAGSGYYRMFDYGSVIYVPDLGPIALYQRVLVEPGEPVTPGYADMRLVLSDSNVEAR